MKVPILAGIGMNYCLPAPRQHSPVTSNISAGLLEHWLRFLMFSCWMCLKSVWKSYRNFIQYWIFTLFLCNLQGFASQPSFLDSGIWLPIFAMNMTLHGRIALQSLNHYCVRGQDCKNYPSEKRPLR